jgi:hypothetical protein
MKGWWRFELLRRDMDRVPGRTWGWLGPSGSLCNELFISFIHFLSFELLRRVTLLLLLLVTKAGHGLGPGANMGLAGPLGVSL